MHPAEAAGREDPDARAVGQRGGRGHRRRAGPTERDRDAEVAGAELQHVVLQAQPVQLGRREADPHDAVEDGHRRGHRASGAHRVLDLVGHPAVVAARQAVGEDRALQRDDAAALGERGGDAVVDDEREPRTRRTMAGAY